MNKTREIVRRGGGRPVKVITRSGFGLDTNFVTNRHVTLADVGAYLRAAMAGCIVTSMTADNMPCFIVFAPGGRVLLIEVRTQATRLNGDQNATHATLRKLGFSVATVRCVDEARAAVRFFDTELAE